MRIVAGIQIIGLIFIWYITSSTAVLLSKSLFSGAFLPLRPFGFPLTILISSNIVCYWFARLYTSYTSEVNESDGHHRYALFIGILSAGEVGLKGLVLKELTVTLSTMLKGTSPLFVLAWGIAFGIYNLNYRYILVVLSVAFGLVMAVTGQSHNQSSFDSLQYGVVAAFIAGVISGLRWVVTQVFIKGEILRAPRWFTTFLGGEIQEKISPMFAILLTAPYTAAAVLPFTMYLEGDLLYSWILKAQFTEMMTVLTTAILIGCCVFGYLWTGFELIKRTSSLTVSIGTVARELLTIGASIIVFGDRVTLLGGLGFSLVQLGILLYAFEKAKPSSIPEESIPLIEDEDCSGMLT